MNQQDTPESIEALLLAWGLREVAGQSRRYTRRSDPSYGLLVEASGSGLDELILDSVSYFINAKKVSGN